ncbi:MAG: NAD(P)H-dependent oxidoreductase subunit E [Bacillota bacterium]|nr:NAD(P)H-dependent oxidoreductase subunit E [Bacillota bacterium]MDI7250000.1 NAD(P)H-dependent oxidoreductase subunit E [Bacillota bacterium]
MPVLPAECLEESDPRFARLDEVIERYGRNPSALIQVLHEAQKLFGYLPEQVQMRVARRLGLPVSHVFGVSTFYALFSLRPVGRHRIQVCMGTACYVKGGEQLLADLQERLGVGIGETTADGRFELQAARCLGCCGLSPVITVDGDVYAECKPRLLPAILKKYD